jgi:GNAT superfamily N-acetyltransferase
VIEAVEIIEPINLQSQLLLERVTKGRTDKTREFAILREGSEVGLLIFEDWKQQDGFIYEIFVLRGARNSGVGSWILSYAERLAAGAGKARVCLTVRSLCQDELSDEDLSLWYERRGYVSILITAATHSHKSPPPVLTDRRHPIALTAATRSRWSPPAFCCSRSHHLRAAKDCFRP